MARFPACLALVRSLVAFALLAGASGPVAAEPLQPGVVGNWFPASNLDPGPRFLFDYFAETEPDWCRTEDGGFVVVRATSLPNWYTDPVDVVAERYDAKGNRVGATINVNPAPARYLPQVACNGSGDFVVSWSNQAEGARLFRVYDRSGQPLSDPVELKGWNVWRDDCRLSALGLSPQDLVVASALCWRTSDGQSAEAGSEEHYDVRVFAADGQPLGEHPDLLVMPRSGWWIPNSAIAIDGEGNALVIARSDSARLLADLADGGQPLGNAFAPLPTLSGAEIRAEAVSPGLFRVLTGGGGDWSARWVSLDGTAPAVTSIPDPKFDESLRRQVVATAPRAVNWRELPPPDLATTGGSWVLAQFESWTDVQEDNRGYWSAVTVRRSVDQGRTWAEPIVLSPDEWRTGAPSIAADGNGGLVVVWSAGDEYRTRILASSSGDGGNTWSPAVEVVNDLHSDRWCNSVRHADVRVATDGKGQWLVVWGRQLIADDCSERNVSLGDGLFASRSSDGGKSWEPPSAIAWDAGYGGYGLDVVADGTGRWVVAWSDDAVRTATSIDASSWSEPVLQTPVDVPTSLRTDTEKFYLDRYPYSDRQVSLASDGAGSVLLAATSGTANPERFGRDADLFTWLSEDGGGHWRSPRAVASWAKKDGLVDRWPTVARDSRGRWIVSWYANRLLMSQSRDGLSWENSRAIEPSGGWWKPGAFASSSDVTMLACLVPVGISPEQSGAETRVVIAGDSCGDGRVDSGESCDDGNAINGDGCDSNCTMPACGNGVVGPGEECDDGNGSDDDGCTTQCRTATCGDGIRRVDVEPCDDGNTSNADSCIVGCVPAHCGDGFVQAGVEQCDDGNWDDNDDCVGCRFPACGDGRLHPSTEECDDGNSVSQDACTADCKVARCGDGSWNVGVEECDPSIDSHADYCTADCRLATCPDADANSVVSASDAVRILGRSVGLQVDCPKAACDANLDGRIGVVDARLTLRNAVGVEGDAICGTPTWPPLTGEISVHLVDLRTFGAFLLDVEYPSPVDLFDATGQGKPDCESDVPSSLRAFHSAPGKLTVGIASIEGVQGVTELFRCRYYGLPPGGGAYFHVRIVEASGLNGDAMEPPAKLVLSRR